MGRWLDRPIGIEIGKDMAKDRCNRNGRFSSKHLRLKEAERQIYTRSQASKK